MNETQEQPVVTVRGSVLIYDESRKKWLPAGDTRQQIEAKVQLFHHVRNGSYRIVARQVQDLEAVLNCSLYPGMKYNVSTPNFHQWRSEQRRLYGLNFLNNAEAQTFGQAVLGAVQELSGGGAIGHHQNHPNQLNYANATISSLDGRKTPTSPSRNAFISSKSLSIGTYETHRVNNNDHLLVSCASSMHQHLTTTTTPNDGHQCSAERPSSRRHATSNSSTKKHLGRTASTAGDYASQRYHHQRRQQQREEDDEEDYDDDDTRHKYTTHTPLIVKHQQHHHNNRGGGDCPRSVQQHRRRLSAGSSGSGSSASMIGGVLSTATQTSNLIFSTVTPRAVPITGPLPPPPPPPLPRTPSTANCSSSSKTIPPHQQQSLTSMMVVVPPPPPPLPPVGGSLLIEGGGGPKTISLAQAINSAKLRKVAANANGGPDTPKDARSRSVGSVESGLSRATVNSSVTLATTSNTSGSSGGHSDVISEMAATLARRRMIVDSGAQVNDDGQQRSGYAEKNDPPRPARVWETRNGSGSRPSLNDTTTTLDSPKTHRKMPSGSSLSSQEDAAVGAALSLASTNGHNRRCISNGQTQAPILIQEGSLDHWKEEILSEVRRELNKAKSDIIDALRMELNRR